MNKAMDYNQVLTEVIAHLETPDKSVKFDWQHVQQWQKHVLKRFVSLKLLSKTINTVSLECIGCEQHCFMPVLLTEDQQRAFIVCDAPDKQDHMGRIKIPLEYVQQWQTSAKQFAAVISGLLGIETKSIYIKNSASYKLGMLKSDNGRRWVMLNVEPFALMINQQAIPVSDCLFFESDTLTIDHLAINTLLNLPPQNANNNYSPNTSKREKNKLATQAMHQDWNDEYEKRKQDPKNKSRVGFDTWCAKQIAKLPIAQGKSSETIRKNMK